MRSRCRSRSSRKSNTRLFQITSAVGMTRISDNSRGAVTHKSDTFRSRLSFGHVSRIGAHRTSVEIIIFPRRRTLSGCRQASGVKLSETVSSESSSSKKKHSRPKEQQWSRAEDSDGIALTQSLFHQQSIFDCSGEKMLSTRSFLFWECILLRFV